MLRKIKMHFLSVRLWGVFPTNVNYSLVFIIMSVGSPLFSHWVLWSKVSWRLHWSSYRQLLSLCITRKESHWWARRTVPLWSLEEDLLDAAKCRTCNSWLSLLGIREAPAARHLHLLVHQPAWNQPRKSQSSTRSWQGFLWLSQLS